MDRLSTLLVAHTKTMWFHLLFFTSIIVHCLSSAEDAFAFDGKIWSLCDESGTCSCGPDVFGAVLCSKDELRIQDCYCVD